MFHVIGVAKISINVFYISAVKFENPSPVAILTGRHPMSLVIFIVLARSCISLSFTPCKKPSPIHNLVTIYFATPRKRQCIGLLRKSEQD